MDQKDFVPSLWFLWPAACPMAEEKADSGEPAPMACMGGTKSSDDDLRVSAACWHTGRNCGQRFANNEWGVLCSFNPATDYWDHPGGKLGAPREPAPLDEGVPLDLTPHEGSEAPEP